VLIDEFAPLVIQNPESEELICSIAQEGKEVGVFIILSSSKASKNVYTKKVLDTITKRLIGSITSQDGSLLLLGEKGAEELEGRGDMILKDTENNEKIRIQTPYISHEDIMNVIDKYLVSSHIDKKNPPPKVEEIEEISVSEEEIKQLQREYKNITIQIIQRKLRLPYKQAIAVYKRINRK
jgi:DNA segregation ATPase FtsK/SpoIIIE-like protein